jgi:hypothetical protein
MKHRLLLIVLAALCAVASASGQTIRTLGYNTTNGRVVYSGTNTLTFTNGNLNVGDFNVNAGLLSAYNVTFDFEQRRIETTDNGVVIGWGSGITLDFGLPINFGTNAATTRTNLSLGATWLTNTNVTNFRSAIGLPWSGLTNTNASGFRSALELSAGWLTNTNVTNFRTAIGLGAANDVQFGEISVDNQNIILGNTNGAIFFGDSDGSQTIFYFDNSADKVTARSDLDLPLPALTNTSNVTMMRSLAGSTNTNEPFTGIVNYTDTLSSEPYEMTVSNGIILKIEAQ